MKKNTTNYKDIDVPITNLKPYSNNPRNNAPAVPDVKKSIAEFGFANPIIVTPDMEIICGHTRYRAAVELGLETVPCRVVHGLSDKQIKKLRIVDNRTAEKAEWTEQLMEEIEAIDLDPDEYDFSSLIKELSCLDRDFGVPDEPDDTGQVVSSKPPKALRAVIDIPPRLWLTASAPIVKAFNDLAAEYGVTVQWPD